MKSGRTTTVIAIIAVIGVIAFFVIAPVNRRETIQSENGSKNNQGKPEKSPAAPVAAVAKSDLPTKEQPTVQELAYAEKKVAEFEAWENERSSTRRIEN